ncbi:MAG: SGNH/GDSL hydrolase family protein [Ktedonobacterales bacterium]
MRIVFLGDSLTEGSEGAPYLDLLRRRGDETGAPHAVELVNAGVGGDTAEHLLARLDADALARQPDAVVIFAGVNDCTTLLLRSAWPTPRVLLSRRYFRRRKGVRGAVTPARYAAALRALVNGMRQAGIARIALCTPAALGESLSARPWRALDRYAEAARAVAEECGCAPLDIHAAFASALAALPPPRRPGPMRWLRAARLPRDAYEARAQLRGYSLTYDGVHLTRRGAELVASVIWPWVVAQVASASSDVT